MMYGFWNIERDSVMDIIFCHLGLFFAFFPPLQPKTSKFWKTGKTTRRYYPITHVYHKWQSYDVWFLRHEARWREFFVILDNFLPIYPLKSRKSKILKKWIKGLEILSFYTSLPKIMICATEIWHVMDVIVTFQFGLFFALLPKRAKKSWSYDNAILSSFAQKSWSHGILFLRYSTWWK